MLGMVGSHVGDGWDREKGEAVVWTALWLLTHARGPCAVLGRDTVRQTLTLHQ